MREQVQCTSSFRDPMDLALSIVRVRVPPTVPDYGTISLKRRRSSSLDRLCSVFVPFSAVSVACFHRNDREANSQEFVSSTRSVVSGKSRKAFPVK